MITYYGASATNKSAKSHNSPNNPRPSTIYTCSEQTETINIIKSTASLTQSNSPRNRRNMQPPKRKWKTNIIFLAALWIILLIASVTILSSAVTPFLRSLQTQTLISLDWAGYAVSSNNLFPLPQVIGVNASWTVPKVEPTAVDTFSAAWIGIGGQMDTTLIQAGTEQDSISGQAVYSLWYELLPANSITIPNVKVLPGDQITASIQLLDSKTNTWLVNIADLTAGTCFSQNCTTQNLNYNSSRLTAEWIMERPTVNNQISTLSNFGTITFNDISAMVSGKVGTLNAFPNYQVIMQDRQNNQLVTVSAPNRSGSSFTVSYG